MRLDLRNIFMASQYKFSPTLVVSVAPDAVDEGLLAPEPLGDLVHAGQVGDQPAGGALESRARARGRHRPHAHRAVLAHVANLQS